MSVQLQQGARPPYVEFREDSAEDRAASEKEGKLVMKSVNTVIIRQVGSKDSVEKNAEEWLANLRHNPNMDPAWIPSFNAKYAMWKEGTDPVADGTHVKLWPAISKAQAEMLLAANIRTVEDLAVANEPSLQRVGIGARELQQKAKAWIDSVNGPGKASAELESLRTKTRMQDEMIAQLQTQMAELAARVPTPRGKKHESEDEDFLSSKN